MPDASTSVWLKCMIGIVVCALHFSVLTLFLNFGHGTIESDAWGQREGGAISVTFVTFVSPAQTALAPIISPPPFASAPEDGQSVFSGSADVAAVKIPQVIMEEGEHASLIGASQASPEVTRHADSDITSSAFRSDRPGDSRLTNYHAVLRAAIRRKWATLTDRPFPSECGLQLNLGAGGTVNATSASGCALSNEDRLQLEAAALMAQPMPYAGYETVFASDLQLEL